jgi:hypothetical protein
MQPSTESPFKRDEPVGRSAKWMWLAAVSATVWTASTAWDMLRLFELTMDTLWRVVGVALRVALVILLFRATHASSRCRKHRSFDVMAAAVRSQRPFWALLAVAGAAGSMALVVNTLRAVDFNRAIQTGIERQEERQEAFKRWIEANPEAYKRMMEQNAGRGNSPQP